MELNDKYRTGVQKYEKEDFSESYKDLIDVYDYQKESNEALNHEHTIRLYLMLSDLEAKKNNIEQSIILLNELLLYDKNCIAALINLSNLVLDKGEPNKAIDLLLQAKKINPNVWQIYAQLYQCYIRIFDFDKARASIEKAKELEPKNSFIDERLKKISKPNQNKIDELKKKKELLLLDDKNINKDGSYSNELIQILMQLGDALIMNKETKEGIDNLKAGPGYINLRASVAPKVKEELISETINNKKTPNFIGSWLMKNTEMCNEMINYFEDNEGSQKEGKMTTHTDKSKKDSLDISFAPYNAINNTSTDMFIRYFDYLHNCFYDYASQWPFLRDEMGDFHIGIFNIQKYNVGGHFKNPHTERSGFISHYRYFAFMTYLNDVEDGGETVFPHFDVKIKPKKGRTLIWPSDWTHMHYGDIVGSEKYIITGWIERH